MFQYFTTEIDSKCLGKFTSFINFSVFIIMACMWVVSNDKSFDFPLETNFHRKIPCLVYILLLKSSDNYIRIGFSTIINSSVVQFIQRISLFLGYTAYTQPFLWPCNIFTHGNINKKNKRKHKQIFIAYENIAELVKNPNGLLKPKENLQMIKESFKAPVTYCKYHQQNSIKIAK